MTDPKITSVDRIVAEMVKGNVSELEKNLQNIQLIKLRAACELLSVDHRTLKTADIPKVWISGNIYFRVTDIKNFIDKQVSK